MSQPNLHYWQYFIALEHDLAQTTRFVEPIEPNFGTFSIEFARIVLAAGSEIEVLAKVLCERDGLAIKPENIDGYRKALMPRYPRLAMLPVQLPRYGYFVQPWLPWEDGQNPTWWRAYNDIKHERGRHFTSATLSNALYAVAGLFVLVCYLCHAELRSRLARPWPKLLSLDSALSSRESTDLRPGHVLPDFRT